MTDRSGEAEVPEIVEISENTPKPQKIDNLPRKTKRLDLFSQWYNLTQDVQQSAIQAGYTPKTAEKHGYKLLDKAEVLGLIEQDLLREAPRVLQRIKKLAKGMPIGSLEKVTPQAVLEANKEILERVSPKKQVIEQVTLTGQIPQERIDQLFSRLRGRRDDSPG